MYKNIKLIYIKNFDYQTCLYIRLNNGDKEICSVRIRLE